MRGQATTEAALGILAISTVIVFGIHFSEISILSLKVQEANASAISDATGKKMHDLTGATPDMGPRTTAISAAGPDAAVKYADFDGRASKNGAAPTLVFTQASPVNVTCQEDLALLPAMGALGPLGAVFPPTTHGGMACWAEADVGLVPRFSRNFLQNRPYRVQHVQRDTYHLCSMGRANGNACGAQTLIALGDWGLTDGAEAANCDVTPPGTPCSNTGYYLMAESAFNANGATGKGAGRALSQWLYGNAFGGPAAQVLESAFFMAAVGENGTPPFQTGPAEHNGWGPYTVTPGGPYDSAMLQSYPQAAQQREPCAFGLPCDPAQWPSYQ